MPTLAELKDSVVKALDQAGYNVKEGQADLFEIDDCDKNVKAFDTSFGNNPAAPYIVPAVPQGDGEVYDYGKSMQSESNTDLYWTYRLEQDEAILMFGNMPPEGAFVGYETFLFTRHFDGEDLTGMDWLSHCVGLQHHLSPNPDNLLYDSPPLATTDGQGGETYPDNPERVTLFANGPTINRRTLERLYQDQGGDFWGQQAIFSTSPDAAFEDALNNALGTELAKIHVHSPLGPELNYGLGKEADDFWTLMRYAVPKDREEGDAWRYNLADNLVVLRVSKKSPGGETPHPTFVFEAKDADFDERVLAADLQKVANAVAGQLDFGGTAWQEIGIMLSDIPLHAPSSIPMAMSAVGATHDADYRMSLKKRFESKDFLAIVGVNHTVTGNASYVSLGIYDAGVWKGIKGISQGVDFPAPGEKLHGSAEAFFQATGQAPSGLTNDLSNFYVQILARPDANLPPAVTALNGCTLIHDSSSNDEDVVLEYGKTIRVTERAYLNPNANASCGPDHTKLLSMIVLGRP